MSSWTSIAGSWGCFAGVVVLGWYYYTKDNGQLKRIGRRKSTGTIEEALKEIATPTEQKKSKPKKKTQKTQSAEVIDPDTKGKAPSNIPNKKSGSAADSARSSAVEVKASSTKETSQDTDVGVKEFAQRMAKAQAGTTFSNTKKEGQRIRTQKQSKVNGSFEQVTADNQEHVSGTSSNAGADADDDLSSVASAPHTDAPVANGSSGVADMLEAVGPGPSTLRITEPQFTKVPQKHVKKEQVVETKKQRQNRVKREREKEANREAEAQRRILEEKQRRTAREAEGRPAKNGNGWTYDSGLPANAWSSGNVQAKPTPTTNGPLLDTTEEPAESSTSGTARAAVSKSERPNGIQNGDSSSNGVKSQWETDLPSEEEQFRLIQEQSEKSEWTTVAQPKRTKRKNTITEDSSKKAPEAKQQSLFPAGFQTDVMD